MSIRIGFTNVEKIMIDIIVCTAVGISQDVVSEGRILILNCPTGKDGPRLQVVVVLLDFPKRAQDLDLVTLQKECPKDMSPKRRPSPSATLFPDDAKVNT